MKYVHSLEYYLVDDNVTPIAIIILHHGVATVTY